MSTYHRRQLGIGCKQQQERMSQEAARAIEENFQNTSEFWQCHQCRKITYDMFNGTFTHSAGFNIDKHLQPLLLEGFYTIFPDQTPSNSGITAAQIKKKEKLQNCWRFIFLNACHATRDRKEAISVSLTKSHYKKGGIYHCNYWNYGELQAVINSACDTGYFRKHKGQQGEVSFITRLQMTSKFHDLIEGYILRNQESNGGDLPNDTHVYDAIQVIPLPRPARPQVVIKMKDNVYREPSRSSHDVNSMYNKVERYNNFMNKQNIDINIDINNIHRRYLQSLLYSCIRQELTIVSNNSNNNKHNKYTTTHPPTNDPSLVNDLCYDNLDLNNPNIAFRYIKYNCQRIFTKNMKSGGRFYGIVIQQLSKMIRSKVMINSSPMLELDYKAIHPSLLYSSLGIQPPANIYVFEAKEDKSMRALIKFISLIVFNAADKREALNAIRMKYYEEFDVMLKNVDIEQGLELFFEHNPELRQFSLKGVGGHLQYEDSRIMDKILSSLIKQNIPAIPVHDSVIVPSKDREEVIDVMVHAYQVITKTTHIPWISY